MKTCSCVQYLQKAEEKGTFIDVEGSSCYPCSLEAQWAESLVKAHQTEGFHVCSRCKKR